MFWISPPFSEQPTSGAIALIHRVSTRRQMARFGRDKCGSYGARQSEIAASAVSPSSWPWISVTSPWATK